MTLFVECTKISQDEETEKLGLEVPFLDELWQNFLVLREADGIYSEKKFCGQYVWGCWANWSEDIFLAAGRLRTGSHSEFQIEVIELNRAPFEKYWGQMGLKKKWRLGPWFSWRIFIDFLFPLNSQYFPAFLPPPALPLPPKTFLTEKNFYISHLNPSEFLFKPCLSQRF